MRMRRLNSRSGFSLIETMIAIGIGGILILALTSTITYLHGSVSQINRKIDSVGLERALVDSVIRDSNFCSCNFGGGEAGTSPIQINPNSPPANLPLRSLKRFGQNCAAIESLAEVNQPVPGNPTLIVSGIRLERFAVSGGHLSANLRVDFTSNSPGAVPLLPIVLPAIAFTTVPAGASLHIASCLNSSQQGFNLRTFENPGAYNFTVPTGVSTIMVELWGGGGGGCGGIGGAGGGGGYSQCVISVSPGQQYQVSVGSGGRSGGMMQDPPYVPVMNCNAANGQDSSFVSSPGAPIVNCRATGGRRGDGVGGAGGAGQSAVGATILSVLNLTGAVGTDLARCPDSSVVARGGGAPRGGDGGGPAGAVPAGQSLEPGSAPGGGGPASCWATSPGPPARINGYSGPGGSGAVHVRW